MENLSKKGITLSVAESCTGGMLGSVITSVPGSSKYFLGGAVTYSNDAKEALLNVSKSTMIANGSVSEETALEMADGVRKLFGSDLAASITGVAGPDGGTAAKPVGLVWIGISFKNGTFAVKFNFDGGRDEVRASAVSTAMKMLFETAKTFD
ncbi:MAG: CinA family protein [Methanomassiliicoccaceae archaeon]|nr:CinA family protein [Methanomassiliicoccaceae archaeon]